MLIKLRGSRKSSIAFTNANDDGRGLNIILKVGEVIDQDPFVAYKINRVLMPRELFKASDAADAPAQSPKPAKKKNKNKNNSHAADAPADGPSDDDADSEDQKAADEDSNGVSGLHVRFFMVFFSLIMAFLAL